MKKTFLIILPVLAVLSLGSCKKWLDVKPSNQISDEELFKDADGIRVALNGIYQNMGDAELYGRQLTWGLNSALGQDYTANTISLEYQKVMDRLFTDPAVTPGTSKTWGTAYTTIANINKLLKVMDTKDSSFFPLRNVEKNLITGEALALRALLHFELLRLFAPAPVNDNAGKYLPYQTTYPAPITAPSSTSDIAKHIIEDLVKAQSLVAQNDTITNKAAMSGKLGTLMLGGSGVGGVFFGYRMNRLNYVAIHALLARVYLYIGDRTNAKKEAEYVYKDFSPTGRLKWWAFTTEANSKGLNRYTKLADDIILAFYDPNLIVNTKNARLNGANILTYTLADAANWFPGTERDYRTNLVDAGISAKWLETTSTAQNVPQQNTLLPVLRFSEIYYIYSECLYEEGNTTDALKVFNELRIARGKTTTFSDASRDGFYNELMNEYRREFIAEGQTVFAFKRLNRNIQIGTKVVPMDNKFVIPLPDGEKNF